MYTSVFQKPGGNPFFYPMGGRNLSAESSAAADIAQQSVEFGQHLYSREARQARVVSDEFYHFKVRQSQLNYRKDCEDLFAPFDYVRMTGPQQDDLFFPVLLPATVAGKDSPAAVSAFIQVKAARSFKFSDICKSYLMKLEFHEGSWQLRGYRTTISSAAISIPVTVHFD